MTTKHEVSALAAALFAAGGANAACTKAELQFLQASSYTVAEAITWCNASSSAADAGGGKPDGKVAMKAATPTPQSDTSSGTTTSPSMRTAAAPSPPATTGQSPTPPPTLSSTSQADKNVFAGAPPDSINGTIKPFVKIPGFQAAGKLDPSGGKPREFYFPARGKFLITNDSIETIETPDGKSKAVELLYGRAKLKEIKKEDDPNLQIDEKTGKRTYNTYLADGKQTPYVIHEDIEYVVQRENIANHENLRSGYTYGVLTAPYKFFPKDHSFSSSATIGPYIGWQNVLSDISFKWVGSFGVTSVPVTTTKTSGESTTANRAALSLSTGVLFDLNNKFQLGFLVGADTTGPNSGYQYNGKPWLAIDIGYKFSN